MASLRTRGPSFNTVVDIGASDGRWSRSLMERFPSQNYLLIEAQPRHEDALKDFCARKSNAQYVLKAAGERTGYSAFEAADALGGLAKSTATKPDDITVPMTTVDEEVERTGLTGPYFIKMDTHGFEVPILRGASSTLNNTAVLLIECYNYRIAPECLLFHEMCSFLEEFNFKCVDLIQPLHRPYDDTLWQMDLLFVPTDTPGLTYRRYR